MAMCERTLGWVCPSRPAGAGLRADLDRRDAAEAAAPSHRLLAIQQVCQSGNARARWVDALRGLVELLRIVTGYGAGRATCCS